MTRPSRPMPDLPEFLYRIFSRDGCLAYVGVTGDLRSRIRVHTGAWWWPEGAVVTVETFTDRKVAEAAEAYAIEHEAPEMNVTLNRREADRRAACSVGRERLPQVRSPALRERSRASKLNYATAEEIRAAYGKPGVTQRQLAAKYGVCAYTIACVVRRRRWTEAPEAGVQA